jgi:manganese-dependent inorganic pyrophosphatase
VNEDEVCAGKVTALRLARLVDELPSQQAGASVEEAVGAAMDAPIENYLESAEPTFNPQDLIRDVEQQINRYNAGGFVVQDGDGRIAGVITRINFLTKARFTVALVDHNEFSQAVDGIDEADVVEVIDHHRIGARSTTTPITFINRVVGSTSTIIADMYRRGGTDPDSQTAALMLSAILSDTVILKSPTTTSVDTDIAQWLAGISGLHIDEYGEEMFQAGSEVAGLSAAQIVEQDQKHYQEAGYRFAVSQIEMVGFKVFEERQEEVCEAVAETRRKHGLDFACLMVTDITRETTRLVFDGAERVQGAIQYPSVGPGVFEMRGVLSRKKQVLPYLIDLLHE